MSNHLMNTYARLPIAFERGDGAWLWDETGRRYLDAVSGLGVTALGHAHPAVSAAICEQSRLIMHRANLARIPWQEKLGDRLAHITGLDRAFIGNSGSISTRRSEWLWVSIKPGAITMPWQSSSSGAP